MHGGRGLLAVGTGVTVVAVLEPWQANWPKKANPTDAAIIATHAIARMALYTVCVASVSSANSAGCRIWIAQGRSSLRSLGRGYDPSKDRLPVAYITGATAIAYCRWAGKRVQTPAERQRAAAGIEGRKYPWGNDDPPRDKNFMCWRRSEACPVGGFPRSNTAEGVADLAGGLWEIAIELPQDDKAPLGGSTHYFGGAYNMCILKSWTECEKQGPGASKGYDYFRYNMPWLLDKLVGMRCSRSAPRWGSSR